MHFFFLVVRRPPRSTLSSSSAASDVYKRQILLQQLELALEQVPQQGYPLLLLARRIDKMKELNLPNALCLQCDITDAKQIEDCIQQGEKLYGAIDCLINSAGTAAGSPDPSTQDLAEQYKMIDINCKGMLNAIHAVLPGMKERKAGTIINIGSLTGKKTFPGVSVYCASKFFVHAVTENMREEMAAFNVRFVVVAPGPTQTDMLPEALKAFEPLLPEKIAESAMFAYGMPQDCCVREIVVAPTKFPS
eukprot:TRINITY_DN2934_c0_g1_i2.p1 TRINITY_DN2934_c0_g1~~TRINITY_DN2934_c0_g1_i2.p1  ORF type:complete len:248 (-),score=52.04 TRINITY_DN2934_c0_g1_i2:78-821(-)